MRSVGIVSGGLALAVVGFLLGRECATRGVPSAGERVRVPRDRDLDGPRLAREVLFAERRRRLERHRPFGHERERGSHRDHAEERLRSLFKAPASVRQAERDHPEARVDHRHDARFLPNHARGVDDFGRADVVIHRRPFNRPK